MPVKRKRAADPEELQVLGKSFVETDDTAKMFGIRAETLKSKLKEWAEKFGDKDEDGHAWISLVEPVESKTLGKDKVVETTVTGFKREKRTTRFIDQEKAEAWLKKHKLWSQCTETFEVTEIAEDKIWLLVMEGKLSEDEVNALYEENVTYALVRVTE